VFYYCYKAALLNGIPPIATTFLV